jgi:hypothetical protein
LLTFSADHEIFQSVEDNSVYTSLCEDVYSLVNIQIDLLHEYLLLKEVEKSDVGQDLILSALECIIQDLYQLQIQHRDRLLQEVETCFAFANDFMRMIDCFDDLFENIHRRYPRLKLLLNMSSLEDAASKRMIAIEQEASNLVALYGNDAIFAVQKTRLLVMNKLQQSFVSKELFSVKWESEFHNNEVVCGMIHFIEDYLNESQNLLSQSFLFGKIVGATLRSVVCFYVKCLIEKANRIRLKKRMNSEKDGITEIPFVSPSRAAMRMFFDIELLRTYFLSFVEKLPELSNLVDGELSILVILHECLSFAASNSNVNMLNELILVLHRRTGANGGVTRYLMKDLWLLAASSSQHRVLYETLGLLKEELDLLSRNLEHNKQGLATIQPRYHQPGIRISEVLLQFYEPRIHKARFPIKGPL